MSGTKKSIGEVFRVPLLLAAASSIGLLSGLLADGLWDAVSWFGLGLAVATGLWFSLRRGSG